MLLRNQGISLILNLFDQLCTHGARTANKHVHHLVLAQEERIMQHVHRLAQLLLWHHKRDVRLFRTLGKRNHADAVSAQRTEQFACHTRSMLHLFAHDTYGCQTLLHQHRVHLSHFDLLAKLAGQHGYCGLTIFILNTQRGGVLRRRLTHQEHRYARCCQRTKDTLVHTNHTYHRQT